MKFSNDAFFLYDGLVAISLLSVFILFFGSFVSVLQKQTYYYDIEYDAISYYRKSIFNYDKTGEFIKVKDKNIYSLENESEYCVYYLSKEKENKICFFK